MSGTNAKPTYEELEARLAEALAEADSLKARVASLQRDNGDLAKALAGVIAELGDKKDIIKRYNLERFYSKRDSVYKDAAKAAEAGAKGAAGGKKRGRKKGSKSYAGMDLERLSKESEPITLDAAEALSESERASLVRIGEATSYLIEVARARIRVRKVVRPAYRAAGGRIIQAPSSAPIPGSYAGPSLLADCQFSKFEMGVPEYRYQGWLSIEGLHTTSQTINGWVLGAADAERPVYDEISSSLASSGALEAHVDETPIEMIRERSPKSGKLGKSGYMFALSADGARKLRLYRFSKTRETSPTVDGWLKEWNGGLVVDGYSGYDRFDVEGGMTVQRCLAHARRKWADLAKVGRPGASERCVLFDEVFASEREIASKNPKTPEERLTMRRGERAQSAAEALKKGMREALASAPEKSPEWSAANYFCSMEEGLMAFMEDGSLTCDNNAAERCCKKVVMSRRNFLFVQSERGGQSAAVALTLIETAAANGVEPLGYLEWVLSHALEAQASPKDFLPWSPNVPESIKMGK
jgi:transposase